MSKVNDLINELKAPKTQYNSFGKYHYRSNEDIQSGLKPLLAKYDLQLEAKSNLREVADKITAVVNLKLYDGEKIVAQGDGFAVVDLNKKGMSSEQATGSAFSYASKYAFGQMLLIDDTKDADTGVNPPAPASKPNETLYTMAKLTEMVNSGKMSRQKANSLVAQGLVTDANK